ncbi:MAG: ABC transporter permease [Proteobacteria bacterium]|nr:ABC transporter permease [Pseudomonadota bacterium]
MIDESTAALSNQQHFLVHFMLAEEMGKIDEAADFILAAFRKDIHLPLTRHSVLWMAKYLAQRNEFRCGLAIVSKLDVSIDDWEVCSQKAKFLALNRQFSKALNLLRATWKHIPKKKKQDFGLFEARLLLNLKHSEEAYIKLNTFLKRPAGHSPLYHRAIKTAVDQCDWAFAKRLLSHSSFLFGPTPTIKTQLAQVHFNLEEYAPALKHANQALSKLVGAGPKHLNNLRILQELKCDAQVALNTPFNSVRDLLKHLEQDKEWTEGKLKVIDCCLRAKKTTLAAYYFAKWFNDTDLSPEIVTLKCRLGVQNADANSVASNLQILIENWPDRDLHPDLRIINSSKRPDLQSTIIEEIELPKIFSPKWARNDFATGSNFIRGIAGHLNSVRALILRETKARFGIYKLGYLWAFLEPAVYTAIFVGIFYIAGRQSFYGMSIPLFIVTGVVPYTLFRNCFNQMVSAVSSSKAILVHPKIQVIDIIVTKTSLELSTIVVVFLAFMSGLYFYVEKFFIGNILEILLGFCGLAACGIGLGLITAGIASVFPGIANFIRQGTRLLFFTSGVFFAPEMLPSSIRSQYLAWNPLAQFISTVRNNFTPLLTSQNIELSYALFFALTLLFVGFMFQRIFHFRMMTQ